MKWSSGVFIFSCYYFTVFTGLLQVYYDANNQKLVKSRIIRWYSNALGILTLALQPVYVYFGLQPADLYTTNPLTRYTRNTTIFAQLAGIAFILYKRTAMESCICRTARAFGLLSGWQRHFMARSGAGTATATRQRKLKLLLIAHFIVIWLHTLIVLVFGLWYLIFTDAAVLWYLLVLLIFSVHIRSMLLGVVLPFFLLVWHVAATYDNINARLEHLLLQRRRGNAALLAMAHGIWSLLAARAKFARLMSELCLVYRFLLLFKLLGNFLNLITIGYYIVVLVGKRYEGSAIDTLLGLIEFVLTALHMYTFNELGERVQSSFVQTNGLLVRQSYIRGGPRDSTLVGRCCEQFSLHAVWPNGKIELFNTFVIHRALICGMITKFIMYTVVLVQSDYFNIWN